MAVQAVRAAGALFSPSSHPSTSPAPSLCSYPRLKPTKPWPTPAAQQFNYPSLFQASSFCAAATPFAAPLATYSEEEEEEEEGHALGLPLFGSDAAAYDDEADDVNGYHVDIDDQGFVDDNGAIESYVYAEKSQDTSQNGQPIYEPDLAKKTQDDTERYKLKHGRQVFEERSYLVGIERKGVASAFGIEDSLAELGQLSETAGLVVKGSTYQKLEHPNPRTYIGSGKVAELKAEVRAHDIETVIFDDELSPGQLRNLEKALGNEVRVCDRTALILDIFSQRAATKEATLQVELAQMEYQLPRLTKMWSHLERQAGGMVKGMGEKQIEVDKRILRSRMGLLRKELDSVRGHRQQYRDRRGAMPIPVVSLMTTVGYTNAGKSTLLNRLSGAEVFAEDLLFATLDPTTRKIQLPNGNECLLTDTVGFIQKLPTQLVASFRATLEEINDSSLLVHLVDISHPLAMEQMEAVDKVLTELNVEHIPRLTVWNKIDKADKELVRRAEMRRKEEVVCISAFTGEGVDAFCKAVQEKLKDSLVWVDVLVPYVKGEFVNTVHRLGVVESVEYVEDGIALKAHVPLRLSRQLQPMKQTPVEAH